jgi:hypothetical protein
MQFVEASMMGLRAGFFKLRSREAQCTYTILPMIHVGDQRFYDEALRELERHDLILYESVDHPFVRSLAQGYERIAASPRIKLTTQKAALGSAARFKGKWVHLDASRESVAGWWKTLPLWQRIILPPLKLALFFWLRKFGDRMDLGARLATNDLRRSEEILDWEEGPSIWWLMSEQRDKAIVANLERFHATAADKPMAIAILFGAAHMRAITHHLMSRHRFHIFDSRWVTVFGWETP